MRKHWQYSKVEVLEQIVWYGGSGGEDVADDRELTAANGERMLDREVDGLSYALPCLVTLVSRLQTLQSLRKLHFASRLRLRESRMTRSVHAPGTAELSLTTSCQTVMPLPQLDRSATAVSLAVCGRCPYHCHECSSSAC